MRGEIDENNERGTIKEKQLKRGEREREGEMRGK